MTATTAGERAPAARVLTASLVGTAVEFYDFYIYATAASLVFPTLFFPSESASAQLMSSYATFAIAFIARPVGAVVFGHFGDKIGRKSTLVWSLMLMGGSTMAIAFLPTYAMAGWIAPLLLCILRFGQGLGLGGEWGGAALLAVENAPPGWKARFGMFPQLGAPIGFILSTGAFILLTSLMSEQAFLAWGWRAPFLASSVLVLVGLWVRLRITETPEFSRVIERAERVRTPVLTLLARYKGALILGTLGATTTFLLFYLMTVFALSWATTTMGFTRAEILPIQLVGVIFFGAFIPIAALAADRFGQIRVLIAASVGIGLFGFLIAPLFSGGLTGLLIFFSLGFALMGATYGPLSAAMARPFRAAVRYTGASMAFNLAGIAGASLAPYAATSLAKTFGVPAVGLYLAATATITVLALIGMSRLKDED